MSRFEVVEETLSSCCAFTFHTRPDAVILNVRLSDGKGVTDEVGGENQDATTTGGETKETEQSGEETEG